MSAIGHPSKLSATIGSFILLAGVIVTGTAVGQPDGIDAQAVKLLRTATKYLADQKQFSADTRSSIEVVLQSGQKIQFDHAAVLSVQRPNKLRAQRRGDLVDQAFYYDGKTLTLYNPEDGYYATLPAPGTIEEMLDYARESLDIVAPGGDLIYSDAFDILMADVTSGFVVGKSVVAGVRCDHLAFRAPQVDWQIWIQEGAQPVPRKLVITSTDIAGAPQFAALVTDWNLAPKLGDEAFVFTPRSDARQIDFLPVGGVEVSAPSPKE